MTKPKATPRLPKLDRAALAAEEAARVRAEIDRISDPVDRLRCASRLADEADAAFAAVRPLRDAAALSLAAHDGVRGLNNALGMTRTAWFEIRKDREATGKAPRRVARAAEKLPALAEDAARARARGEAARERRDALVGDLLDQGVTRSEVAALIGRNPSRISHIKARQEATG